MELENYRDLSSGGSDTNAGFQFEFYCTKCSYKWKSPFQPYRMGQVSGFLSRFAFLFSDLRTAGRTTSAFADMGSRKAHDEALEEATAKAQTLFTICPTCKEAACEDCFSVRDKSCRSCLEHSSAQAEENKERDRLKQRDVRSGLCPSCSTPTDGGRFCPQCGYDTASTFKTCPGCGVMCARQARFCTDCGHSF